MDFHENNTLFSIEKHIGNVISIDEHFHDFFEFYYLKNGTATYLINSKIYKLVKGDIVIIPPNTLHKTISADNTKRERILLYLDKNFIKSVPDAQLTMLFEPMFCNITDNTRLKTIFEEMLDEFTSLNNRIYLEALICQLLVILQRTAKTMTLVYESADLPGVISDILDYITSNYSSDLTLKNVSEHFYINSSYLSRLFRQHTGFTFCNYLNNYRVWEANKLLAETGKQITEIALDCGFNSSNNFCKCYKRIMKTSPLAYRKNILKGENLDVKTIIWNKHIS